MAAAKYRQQGLVIDKIPECPICLDPLAAPIYQCKSGHDICASCSNSLHPYICPICRAVMTKTRNEDLENAIREAKVSCPNKDNGCVYTLPSKLIEDHLKGCTFRQYKCPQGLISENGNCTWMGKRADMMEHFKVCHSSQCNIKPNTDFDLKNINLKQNKSHLYLTSLDKLLFAITLKIDSVKRKVYMTVQHIGTKTVANQHIYKLEVISKHESRRKVIFTEICESDTMTVDEIINQGKCGVLSFDALNHFLKDNQLGLRYYITKQFNNPKGFDKNEARDENDENNSGAKGGPSRGHRSHSKGPDTRGTAFRGAGHNRGRGHRGGGQMKANKAY